ncbi:MAG: hypothetical protein OXM55_03745 [Bdellovibrionales bacterium]|nr:hypothetical protein [Bdellovibrionales bacterium]
MKITENKFNPHNNQFNTIEEWSKTLNTSTDWWKNKGILKTAPRSILEGSDRLIDLGRGEKLYNFQQTNGKLLAFSDDSIGSPVEINNQIYQFHIDKFLKYLSDKNGFHYSNEKRSKTDYVIGDLPIGDKKIIWICSFSTEGFQKYKTKPYFEELNEQYNFVLLSDCVDSSPNIRDDRLGYVSLPFDSQSFEIDFHKFINKKVKNLTVDEARDHLKDKITFFIDNNLGRIYYKNNLTTIRKGEGDGTQTYQFFMHLLKNPSQNHGVKQITSEFLKESAQDIGSRGRDFKRKIKEALQKSSSNSYDNEIDRILPNIKNGNIKLNLSKKKIFFF